MKDSLAAISAGVVALSAIAGCRPGARLPSAAERPERVATAAEVAAIEGASTEAVIASYDPKASERQVTELLWALAKRGPSDPKALAFVLAQAEAGPHSDLAFYSLKAALPAPAAVAALRAGLDDPRPRRRYDAVTSFFSAGAEGLPSVPRLRELLVDEAQDEGRPIKDAARLALDHLERGTSNSQGNR